MTNPNPLTENELRAIAYFAVGVTSEGGIAGRDLAYRLSFAGNVGAGGHMEPVANSGYSFGTMCRRAVPRRTEPSVALMRIPAVTERTVYDAYHESRAVTRASSTCSEKSHPLRSHRRWTMPRPRP